MSQTNGTNAPKSYVTAILLSFFLGGLGLWSLIDLIMIIMRKVNAADGSALV